METSLLLLCCLEPGCLLGGCLLGPLGCPGDPLELDHVLVALVGVEEQDGSVLLDVHLTGSGLDGCAAEGALPSSVDHWNHLMPSFLASLDVSLSMRMSPILTGPMRFLVMILPLSRPSRTRTLTWVASPVIPVLPMISTTSEGMLSVSTIQLTSVLEGCGCLGDLITECLSLSDIDDCDGSGGLVESDGGSELSLAGDVDVGNVPLLAECGHVGEDLRGLDVGGHDDDGCGAALDGFGNLVGSLLDLSAIPCHLGEGVGLV